MANAVGGLGSTAGAVSSGDVLVWPHSDQFRLLSMLQVHSAVALVASCTALRKQLQAPTTTMRLANGDRSKYLPRLEAEQALLSLKSASAEVAEALGAPSSAPAPPWQSTCQKLQSLEETLFTECRYCYGPDWDIKPGKLVSRKGTWLKVSTRFSWELSGTQKLYLPQGVVMPILQIGKVSDPEELKRHEWVGQHIRVWLKPSLVRTLEARRDVWFVYWPHFEDKGLVIVPQVDTWLKRTTQMSGEMDQFELIYLPKGLPLQLACEPSVVDEEWERSRHQHVHLHRKLVLAQAPITVRQEKYEIFVGQGEERAARQQGAATR